MSNPFIDKKILLSDLNVELCKHLSIYIILHVTLLIAETQVSFTKQRISGA